ncbi:AVAST type 2 anti-phage system protein Avs2 [Paraburkholderia sediminicola]|uniref:AVAST type 2 anti-phage system protein Avs2 n=1 Tax=Paraburkholderia sediminicola TaxID=458836 RepID=UPI0038BA2631
MSLDLDWAAIRPLNGSKRDSFEELCTQLARTACPAESRFYRKGRPDSGVEAYAVHPDATESAWQTKYFHSIGDSQWTQLDESVKAALNGHPRLTRFIVCVPLDLPDGRSGRAKSARERWNARVTMWSQWATRKRMTVEFVWQGSHELIAELAKPEHDGLAQFFFGTRYLDDAWLRDRLAEAHRAAGPRYTPELNIKLSIADEFQALGRTREFFDRVQSTARQIREQIRSHAFSVTKTPTSVMESLIAAAHSACNRALEEFASLSDDPTLVAPLDSLRASLRGAVRSIDVVLSELRREREVAKAAQTATIRNPVPSQEDDGAAYTLRALRSALEDAFSLVDQFHDIVDSSLVILTGEAGSGKTHLLCDLAKQRLDADLPTVVLMGQRFLDNSDPWTQALQQLDLHGWTAKELVNALEVVARQAGRKLLFVIDALNEGVGMRLWPAHLSSFLERINGSRWISTVISVRSSYVDDVLPEAVASSAIFLEHHGFEDLEFDATRAFFEHYGIDLPSTPLLAPEFRNPLYLKTLCQGLREAGECRLPRGFHGVVSAFTLYLRGVNAKAARDLDFNARSDLITKALNSLARHMVGARQTWVSYSEAESIVNALLPGRDYSRSLMAKLISEGLLIEERPWSETEDKLDTVVQIAYERLSDYLCVDVLLEDYLQAADPALAFQPGGPLDFEALRTTWSRPGIHEALHILIAERTGRELIELLPQLVRHYYTPAAFLNSIVWRNPKAVTTQAVQFLLQLKQSRSGDVIDTLITLATIPEHPLNASFTDDLLRQAGMADRDAWWTIGLHGLWEQQSAVDRLIRWANCLWSHSNPADESAELAATIVVWLLTSSNRYLRDHATKALVRILTWRPSLIGKLIEQFADLDDAYVAERVLAAAYGASMRTSDAAGVEAIANVTHAMVFATGHPRPHLLFRDYARGIIKRAEYLRATPNRSSWQDIDPPYVSDWPTIPEQNDIDAIAPEWSDDKAKAFSWGHNRIRSSVMDDDFGRYVIGTNSWSTNWLSLRLKEPQWMSRERRVELAISSLTEEERRCWKIFEDAAQRVSIQGSYARMKHFLKPQDGNERESTPAAEQLLNTIRDRLLQILGADRREPFAALMDEIRGDSRWEQPPKFDLKLVQRYVIGRVFELGWTAERFDQFDRELRSSGRDAAKAERIGKKYQWIAYHEMLAFMADHYQYAAGPGSKERGVAYQGSWQDKFRDIDPSNVIQPLANSDGEEMESSVFWGAVEMTDWKAGGTAESWAKVTGDVPLPDALLFCRDEPSQSEWVDLHLDIKWTMPRPAYEDSFRDGRREIWMHVDGALVKRSDAGKLKERSLARQIEQHGVRDGSLHNIFLGEIGWSEASTYFLDPYYGHMGWAGDISGEGVDAISASLGYSRERGSFDCSFTSESINFRAPTERMLALLGAEWSGVSATYVSQLGSVVAFDPSVNVQGPTAFLVRKENLLDLLQAEDLVVCWVIHGEKIDADGAPDYRVKARGSFHGIFFWDGIEVVGKYSFDKLESAASDD